MITRANSYRFVNKHPARNLVYEYQICLEVFFCLSLFLFSLVLITTTKQIQILCVVLCITIILKKYLLFVEVKNKKKNFIVLI